MLSNGLYNTSSKSWLFVFPRMPLELGSSYDRQVFSPVQHQKNPKMRTYRILPTKSDGMAYAKALAEKYGVTYEMLRRRIS